MSDETKVVDNDELSDEALDRTNPSGACAAGWSYFCDR